MNRVLLEERFTADQIKQRATDYGTLDYIEGAAVIQRLNNAFNSEWSFEITEHHIDKTEVWIVGRLTAGGISKTQFGRSEVSRSAEGEIISLADDLKAAATDGLKKCATLFGVGLHLYLDPTRPAIAAPAAAVKANGNGHIAPPAAPPLPRPNPPYVERTSASSGDDNGSSGTGSRISQKQLTAIFGIALGAGWKQAEIREHARVTYGKSPDYLTKREASAFIDYLKAGRR